jgi:hypothetical protein
VVIGVQEDGSTGDMSRGVVHLAAGEDDDLACAHGLLSIGSGSVVSQE